MRDTFTTETLSRQYIFVNISGLFPVCDHTLISETGVTRLKRKQAMHSQTDR